MKCCSIDGCASCIGAFGTVKDFTADGVAVKQIVLNKKGTAVPQHSHEYDHMTMVATGSVRVFKSGIYIKDYSAPDSIHIDAGTKHSFISLEDNVVLYCIHNISRTGKPEVREEHQLVRSA